MKDNIPPFKYWLKFLDAEVVLNPDNPLPFFCLATRWNATKINFEPDEGEVEEKDFNVMRSYFYGLN